MKKSVAYTRAACYASSVSMSAIVVMSPLLFEIFHTGYDISYTRLGFLAVVNFATQMTMDLIFTLFPRLFNPKTVVKTTPFLTITGFLAFALCPLLFKENAYLFMVLGTVVFSASGGICEVLLSPIIAELPSQNPDRDMSTFHSFYAWGVVGVVIFGTAFLKLVGDELWFLLPLVLAVIPFLAMVLFFFSEFPEINSNSEDNPSEKSKGNIFVAVFCFLAIFFGGASEGAMTQWMSSYLEGVVGIDKLWGDIFGFAAFAAFLALARTLYGKFGKNILRTMIFGALGATLTYTLSALSNSALLITLSCILTGFAVSMLWPGILIVIGQKYRGASVAIYALMAVGGDFGSALSPQLVGFIADKLSQSSILSYLSDLLSLPSNQLPMRIGLLSVVFFTVCCTAVLLLMAFYFKKTKKN